MVSIRGIMPKPKKPKVKIPKSQMKARRRQPIIKGMGWAKSDIKQSYT